MVAPRERLIAVKGITVECGKISGGDEHVAPERLGLLDSRRYSISDAWRSAARR